MNKNSRLQNWKSYDKNAQIHDYFETTRTSNQLVKYSQSRFEEKLKKEHEKSMREYQNGVFKHIQIIPIKQQNAVDDNALRSKKCDTILSLSGHNLTHPNEVVGCQFVPGLQHMPGICNNRVDAVTDVKKSLGNYAVQNNGRNLSLFALLEQNALASQKEIESQNKQNFEMTSTIGLPKHSEPLFDSQSSESFKELTNAQLPLKYYLRQSRPHSAPIPKQKAANLQKGKRKRCKSAKLQRVADNQIVETQPQKFSAKIVASKKQEPVHTNIGTVLTGVKRTSRDAGSNIFGQSFSENNGRVETLAPNGVSQNYLDKNFEQAKISRKVDFGPDVKNAADLQEKPTAKISQSVIPVSPKGILRKTSDKVRLDSALSTKNVGLKQNDLSLVAGTTSDAVAKAIQWSKVSYEDGSAAVFDEMGALTIIQEKTHSTDKLEETGTKGKGKKGKAAKAEEKTGSKKGKGKKKGKNETPVVEEEEPVRRRRKDLGYATKLLYSIAAISPETSGEETLSNINDRQSILNSRDHEISQSNSQCASLTEQPSHKRNGSRRVAWEMDYKNSIDVSKSNMSMQQSSMSNYIKDADSLNSRRSQMVNDVLSYVSPDQLQEKRPGILKLK